MLQFEQNNYQAWVYQVMIDQDKSSQLRGELRHHEPMSKHTSWHVGGTADRFYIPADLEDLSFFLTTLPAGESLLWIGLGSNLLVRDKGIRGTVIATSGALSDLVKVSARIIRIGAGVACAKAARFAAACGLTGIEFLAGIPGTFGGALAMNAGSFGGEIWDYVISAQTINSRGEITTRDRDSFDTGYRSVALAGNEWFVAAEVQLEIGDPEKSRAQIRRLLAKRAEAQPTGELSCGSVFRNPEGDFAGRLIEACELKGKRIGKAYVSDKHANFIINDGGDSAADIESLIYYVQRIVKEKHGIQLQPEVRIIGDGE